MSTSSFVFCVRRFGFLLLSSIFLQLGAIPSFAQYTKLFDFGSRAMGSNPIGSPVSDGTFLYGTASSGGGASDAGTIYKVKADGSAFTTLYEFDTDTGLTPIGDLLFDGTFLYGMTRGGGANMQGAIYKIRPDGTGFAVIFSFQYVATGGFPYGSLITDGTSLYGMTSQGGTSFVGTVFKINKDGTGHTKLVEFTGTANGNGPQGSLFFDGTFLYGMTNSGGNSDLGTIFKVKTDGTGFVKLFDFTGSGTGSNPLGSLISDGTFLYGLTLRGGASNTGAIFKIKTDGTGFIKMQDLSNAATGAGPKGSLSFDGTFLYGLTTQGGVNFAGTAFKIKPDGTGFVRLFDMIGDTNGPLPEGTLLINGTTLYGVRSAGGGGRFGTLFKFNNDGSAFTTLLTFEIEANNPAGRPVSDGTSFYGMTSRGGLNDKGTIYKINSNGSGYTRVFNFEGATTGERPTGSLIFDGTFFYGMTSQGGTNNGGTIFKIRPNGADYQKLLDFDDPVSGSFPNGSLISDGTFLYGMTSQGGTLGDGIIFKIQLNGTNFTKLLDLDYTNNGYNPNGTLILDGTFLYGLTAIGGDIGAGVAFKIKTDGTGFVKLHDFDYPDGSNPRGSLTAIGTTLYGLTSSGGSTSNGTLFKVNNDGTGFDVLVDFDGTNTGGGPEGSLISVGGYLYGMTSYGGLLFKGTLFRIKPDGTGFEKLLDFDDGSQPTGSLTSDGTFLYAVTSGGGDYGLGTFFKVTPTPFVKVTALEPPHGVPGAYITIRGLGFNPVAANNTVSFNGETAVIISGTTDSLVVVVPENATDGPVTITGNTTDVSTDDFIIDTEAEMFEGKVKSCNVTFVEPNTTDDLVETFLPGTPGAKVRVSFTSFDVEDVLNIYDGPDVNSPLLATSADIQDGDEFVATGPGGELTFEYVWQDASSTWTADISCDGAAPSINIDTQPGATTVCGGLSTTLSTVASGATNLTYHWQYSPDGVAAFTDIADGGGYSNTTGPTLTVKTTEIFGAGSYRCRINGNSAAEEFTNVVALVTETCKLVVYNAVSPNGDNKNDFFMIELIDVLPGKQDNKVRIFNRWGDEVFSVSNYNNKDKVFAGINKNGNKLPSGIYFYSIAFTDGSETLKGFLELRY